MVNKTEFISDNYDSDILGKKLTFFIFIMIIPLSIYSLVYKSVLLLSIMMGLGYIVSFFNLFIYVVNSYGVKLSKLIFTLSIISIQITNLLLMSFKGTVPDWQDILNIISSQLSFLIFFLLMMDKKKVAFICVHNSCRSQIAEALGKYYASDIFESYSAGTETKPQINQDAVKLMKKLYGIDMEKEQYSKSISDIPNPDIAISMGCNVGCPFIGRAFDDNWRLDDPTGKSDDEFIATILGIEQKILKLKKALSQ